MAKITWKPGTMEYPLPPVMVSCGTMEKPNIMTAAWTGIVSSEPAMTYVSIRPSRYSHQLIKESGEFVINLTTLPLVTAADFCGVKSGRETDKFKEMDLTAGACSQVSCPQIVESPVSIECKVVSVTNYGSHDMFLAEIVAVNVDDKYLDQDGKLWLEKAGLIAYSHNYYYTLGRNVGFFGFSVCRSALKAKEKMKNVVVEVKEPKIAKPAAEKFNRKKWGEKPAGDRKFDGKRKFAQSREIKFDNDGADSDTPRRSRGDNERRSGERKSFGGRSNGGDRKRFADKKEFGNKKRFSDLDKSSGFSRPRKPREDNIRREGNFNSRPRRPMNKPQR